MYLSKVVYKNLNYKLVLRVYEHFNDYSQHCYSAVIVLYSLDNKIISQEKYNFSKLVESLGDHKKALDHFTQKLETENILKELAFNIYCKSDLK